MVEFKCLLALFIIGQLSDTSNGADPLYTRDVITDLKSELRKELLSELKVEIRKAVKAQLREAVQDELSSLCQEAAKEKVVNEGNTENEAEQTNIDLIKEVIREEIKKLKQERPETATMPADGDVIQVSNESITRRNEKMVPVKGSNRPNGASLNLTPRAFSSQQVAFSVYLDHIMDHVSRGIVLKFNKAQLNENNVYNVHTGIFTAPVSGVYLFHFEFVGWARKTELKLIVDNVIVASSVVEHQSSTSYLVKAGSMTLVRVNSGQAVWVEVFGNDDAQVIASDADKSATFLGVLVY